MNKPVFGLILGGILGVFDGLTALISAPETAPQIVGIVIGSLFKGIVAGVLIGWFAKKVDSLPLGIVFGLGVGLFLAYLVAAMGSPVPGCPDCPPVHYYWEIMIPGAIVGMIVGYATQRYGSRPPAHRPARA